MDKKQALSGDHKNTNSSYTDVASLALVFGQPFLFFTLFGMAGITS